MTSPFRPEDELADPNTPAERLAEIATARIDLSAAIARHPNAHDALLDWIATYGDDAARAAVAQRRGMQPAQPTVAPTQPAQPHGDPPFPQQGAPANPHQPVQDFGQQPDHAFGAQPAPMQPGVAWAPSPVVDAPRKKSKKGLVISLSAVGVVVLVAGSGAVWAASAGLFGGGSNSPEAAASKLVDGALDVDPIALYTSMAPSEMTYLEEAVKTIGDIGDSGDDEYLTVAQDVLDAIDVTSSDLTYETDQLMDEVARVRLIGGTVTIDADVDELEEALRTVAEER
ncbi:variant leucine-rich repeat-containing protein, partial [Microbacterium sp.]